LAAVDLCHAGDRPRAGLRRGGGGHPGRGGSHPLPGSAGVSVALRPAWPDAISVAPAAPERLASGPGAPLAVGQLSFVLDAADAGTRAWLQRWRYWIWLSGNHDPRPSRRFGCAFLDALAHGGVTLRHQPSGPSAAGGEAEISGHLHPVGKVSLRGRAVRR